MTSTTKMRFFILIIVLYLSYKKIVGMHKYVHPHKVYNLFFIIVSLFLHSNSVSVMDFLQRYYHDQ